MSDFAEEFHISAVSFPSLYRLCSNRFTLLYVKSGHPVLVVGGVEVQLHEKEAVLLQCDIDYVLNGKTEGMFVQFSRNLFYRYCMPVMDGNVILNSFFVHDEKRPSIFYLHFQKLDSELSAQFLAMQEEYLEQRNSFENILICQLSTLLLQLSRNCWVDASVTEAPNSQLLQQILQYVVDHYRTVTMEELSETFSYHPNSIAAILKKGTGKNFSALLLQIRMSHAAKLLTDPSLSVRQVAESCGYSNMSNFYSRFKAYYGSTPAEYAHSLLNEESED